MTVEEGLSVQQCIDITDFFSHPPQICGGKMHRSGVYKESAVIFNRSFES
jgi:hypothetical protein